MVCRTVRNFVRQNCPLAAINTNYIVIKLAMKTPKAILVPAGFVGDALQDGLNMCPMLGAVDVTSMPVVGMMRLINLSSITSRPQVARLIGFSL